MADAGSDGQWKKKNVNASGGVCFRSIQFTKLYFSVLKIVAK